MSQANPTSLTLDIVAHQPELVTIRLTLPSGLPIVFRPLEPTDEGRLAAFIEELSPETVAFHSFDGDALTAAQEMCAAINRYDKLRLIAVRGDRRVQEIIALFGFSFDLVGTDCERYRRYGVELDPKATCRFAPCIADSWQNQGLGSRLLRSTVETARRFDRRRIILWGGVQSANTRAVAYYRKNGFKQVGQFADSMGRGCYDMLLDVEGFGEHHT